MNTAPNRARPGRRSLAIRSRLVPPLATALLASAGCMNPPEATLTPSESAADQAAPETVSSAIKGDNLIGANLVGANLVGMNLIGANMGGPNMGGTNLVGMNLIGANMGGTNIGGNNIGGNNMSATNLSGSNLVGMNLVGMNLVGMNLGASNLSGSNVAGTNLVGMNLVGMNLVGMNLASSNTGYNMHNVAAVNGMLWSGEDVWMPRTNQRIVLGLGSTAFAKLLSQNGSKARISVALGKLPWGFSATAGGPLKLEAWEAFVWGDKSYASFLLVAPPGSNWPGVAGFVKAVFRWNAPPSQSVDITGIEASAPHDPTLVTQVHSYTGMMNAGAKFMAGQLADTDFVAGLMAFVTATTNNETVRVDFSSWVRDSSGEGMVLGNVESAEPPQYAEGVYQVYPRSDGSVGVSLSRVDVPVGSGLISSQADLATSYTAHRYGYAPPPIPSRCSGSLYLATSHGLPVPHGKCDEGLAWTESPAGAPPGGKAWSTVHGTTAPMNQYMYLPSGSGVYERAPGSNLRSETYIFMWEPNHVLPAIAIGGGPGADRTSLGVATSSHAACTTSDGPENAFNGVLPGRWCASGNASNGSPRSLMYAWGASIAITGYRITSAASLPDKDPKNWTFQGCMGTCVAAADSGWVTLDTRTNQFFSARLQTNTYTFSNTTAYSQYRLRVSAGIGNQEVHLRELQMMDGGGAVVPLSGVDRTENGIVTWTGRPCSTAELPTRAFDNLYNSAGATRWCVAGAPTSARPVSLGFTMQGGPVLVQQYRITVASDNAARDPRSWTLQGCDASCKVGSDAGWTTLHTRSGQTFSARHQTTGWLFSNTVAYSQYRLRITANNGDANYMQIGELQLF